MQSVSPHKVLDKAIQLQIIIQKKKKNKTEWDENFKNMYLRIVSKQGFKMKVLTAVQRKLLELAYTLFKTKTSYDKLYESKKAGQKNSMSAKNE